MIHAVRRMCCGTAWRMLLLSICLTRFARATRRSLFCASIISRNRMRDLSLYYDAALAGDPRARARFESRFSRLSSLVMMVQWIYTFAYLAIPMSICGCL